MIESYSFGKMVVNGQKYTSDLIIFSDHVNSSWWRETGHRLSLKDLEEVFREKPKAIVVGTGAVGMLKVEEEVLKYAREKGITIQVEKTNKAVGLFNASAPLKKTIGCFHLTC